MKMSAGFMQETAEALARSGFSLEVERDSAERDGETLFDRTRFHLRREPAEYLILEVLTYPDGAEAYYLALPKFHALRSTSFELDSWKHFDDRVEFKYYAHPETGMGLSFVLDLPHH